jgi:hypothetical protein
MPTIGPKTIDYASQVIANLLREHQPSLDSAYRHADGALSVAINVHVEPGRAGTNAVSVGISFVERKVKEKTDPIEIDEDQIPLFEDK